MTNQEDKRIEVLTADTDRTPAEQTELDTLNAAKAKEQV